MESLVRKEKLFRVKVYKEEISSDKLIDEHKFEASLEMSVEKLLSEFIFEDKTGEIEENKEPK